MATAREAILARVRAALIDRPPAVVAPRDYHLGGTRDSAALIELFVERVQDYEATVVVTDDPRVAAAEALAALGAHRVGIAADLDRLCRPSGIELVEDTGLSARDLDALDGAVTTCVSACAETGTIALDGGPGQGRRALCLVPDLHVCIVRAEAIVESVPELIAALEPSAREGRPIVLVSGPSATSDIELTRVEGVHGPRRLVVIVATSLSSDEFSIMTTWTRSGGAASAVRASPSRSSTSRQHVDDRRGADRAGRSMMPPTTRSAPWCDGDRLCCAVALSSSGFAR